MDFDFSAKEVSAIVVLTGAGVSAESGLATFRDQNGLWENHPVEDVATPEAFASNPQLVHEFYNQRRRQLQAPEVAPNLAHHALFGLQKNFPGKVTLITQNVDNLHERAGSLDVLHMHGELAKIKCCVCSHSWRPQELATSILMVCIQCAAPGSVRPDIVWFGEVPYFMDQIEKALATCDVFVAIGTSGQVYPASLFVQMAKKIAGAITIELNLETTVSSNYFDYSFQGKAGELVPKFVDFLLDTY